MVIRYAADVDTIFAMFVEYHSYVSPTATRRYCLYASYFASLIFHAFATPIRVSATHAIAMLDADVFAFATLLIVDAF